MTLRTGLWILLALASGCAANPGKVYHQLQSADKVKIVASPAEAIRAVPAVQLDTPSKRTFQIERTDAIIELGAYRSYFKLFKMNAASVKSYQLTIESFWHCFGHTKTMVAPNVYVLNERGEVIAEGPGATESKGPGLTSTAHLKGTIKFQVAEDGVCFVLVAGDNSRVGGVLDSDQATVFTGTPGQYSARTVEWDYVSSPIGKVSLQVEGVEAK